MSDLVLVDFAKSHVKLRLTFARFVTRPLRHTTTLLGCVSGLDGITKLREDEGALAPVKAVVALDTAGVVPGVPI